MAQPLVPDIAGFRAAQDELIDKLGQDVTFLTPVAATYPPGTQLDPETGKPYDPTVKPSSGGGYDPTVVRCSVVFRAIRRSSGGNQDPDRDEPSGLRRGASLAVTMKVADYPSVQDATQIDLNGLPYKITEFMPDGLTEVQRYICFVEAY